MFDIGWSEMAVIAVVALFVIGPKEIPKALRTVGRYAGKVRAMAREFQATIDEAVREAELDEVRKQIESVGTIETVDPKGELRQALDVEAPRPGSRTAGSAAPAAASPQPPRTPQGQADPTEPAATEAATKP